MDIKSLDISHLTPRLRQIPDAPSKIFIRGELFTNDEPAIAIVGTRKATAQGLRMAREIAGELSNKGIIIVSGLAMGIDTAAHEGALSVGGKTVAVLGNGLDKIYPAQNQNLAEEILNKGGAIVSEYEAGTPSFKQNFIQRNRIISGLSLAVIVVEAPERSGALATAGFAARQGREVFVTPGEFNNYNYMGSHILVREGARLVASVKDIIEDLGLEDLGSVLKKENINEVENLILKVITDAGSHLEVDKIIQLTKLDAQKVNQNLASLLIKGFLEEAGGRYTI
ncbi:MAG: DNA-processing protein DprA [Patescibacteria group bacterium]